MKPLQNQVAIVTGASRGIGLSTAVALAEAGASVAFNYRSDKHGAPAAIDKIKSAGGKAMLVQGDVADLASVERMIDETVAAFGPLTIAVNNAAFQERGKFHEIELEKYHRVINVTLWGAFNLLRTATRRMIANKTAGSIVIISSPHAYLPIPMSMPYNMAKGALNQMAKTAAIELVEQKIRVNLLTPGWVDTPGERKFFSEEVIAKSAAKLPWKRMAQPEEIARGVVFLCDPASDYITGSSLLIDGGGTLPWWASGGSGVPD